MADLWYKREARAFYEGTRQLSLEERGAYCDIIDLIYMHAGEVPDDPKWMSHALHISTRKWDTVRTALINAGKIEIIGGMISNSRARIEIESRANQSRVNAETAVNREQAKREKSKKTNDTNECRPRNEHHAGASRIEDKDSDAEGSGERDAQARDSSLGENETDIGHGVIVNCETIRHASFAISLPSVRMGTLAAGITAEQVKEFCTAHALQWAVEIANGKPPSRVVPDKIANFLSASIMGTSNRAASAANGSRGPKGSKPSGDSPRVEKAKAFLALLNKPTEAANVPS